MAASELTDIGAQGTVNRGSAGLIRGDDTLPREHAHQTREEQAE